MSETTTTIEEIEGNIASVEIEGVLHNINIDDKFADWLEEKADNMQSSLTTEELEYQTREFTSETLKDIISHEQLIIDWIDTNDITSEIEGVFNCCGNEQTYSEDSNICKNCFEHFM